MKKFCNKITKKEWRITVPNLSSPVFRRSPSTLDESDKTSKRSSGFYDFQEAQLEFDKGRSLPNSIYVDSGSSSSSSTGVDEQFQDAQDKTTFLDVKRSTSEIETDQEIYVDVEEPKNIDKNNSRFEYDVPKISFKFCEKRNAYQEESIYENHGPCNEVKCIKKTEVKIVLEQPSLSTSETEPEYTLQDEDIAEALKNIEEEGELLEKSQEFGSQSEILVSRSRESMTIVKSGSDPNIRTHESDDDDDNGFYKVPRSLKIQHRLSQSMNDFDPESMNSEISKSNHSSIEHISCSQVNIARQKLAEIHQNSSFNNSESFDYCRTRSQLPAKERRATLLRKPKKAIDSWNNFKTKMSHMISEQASQQRVGAFSERDKLALNLEEMYKSSKNKCKKVFHSTTKIFSPKASHRRRSVSSSDVDSPKNSSCANSPVVEKQTPTFPRPKLRASDIEYQLNTSDELNGEISNDVSDSDNYSPMSKASELSEDKREEFDFSTIKSAFKKKLVYLPEVIMFICI